MRYETSISLTTREVWGHQENRRQWTDAKC